MELADLQTLRNARAQAEEQARNALLLLDTGSSAIPPQIIVNSAASAMAKLAASQPVLDAQLNLVLDRERKARHAGQALELELTKQSKAEAKQAVEAVADALLNSSARQV